MRSIFQKQRILPGRLSMDKVLDEWNECLERNNYPELIRAMRGFIMTTDLPQHQVLAQIKIWLAKHRTGFDIGHIETLMSLDEIEPKHDMENDSDIIQFQQEAENLQTQIETFKQNNPSLAKDKHQIEQLKREEISFLTQIQEQQKCQEELEAAISYSGTDTGLTLPQLQIEFEALTENHNVPPAIKIRQLKDLTRTLESRNPVYNDMSDMEIENTQVLFATIKTHLFIKDEWFNGISVSDELLSEYKDFHMPYMNSPIIPSQWEKLNQERNCWKDEKIALKNKFELLEKEIQNLEKETSRLEKFLKVFQ